MLSAGLHKEAGSLLFLEIPACAGMTLRLQDHFFTSGKDWLFQLLMPPSSL